MPWLLLRAVLVVVVTCTGQSSQLLQYWRDSSLRNISLLFHIELIYYCDYSDKLRVC